MSKNNNKNIKENTAAYLFHQGTNFYSYKYMGAHKEGEGVYFRVWAPHAAKIFLTGDFNGWKETNPMTKLTEQGIWEVLIPESEISKGRFYKYKIITKKGEVLYKADPYAFYSGITPETASVYYDFNDGFEWTDEKYIDYRKKLSENQEYNFPMNIYEVHMGSWKRKDDGSCLSYREFADEIIPYVKQMGYTHIELMPIMEYPFDGSWGYQITGYYSPTSRYGTPSDFKYLVNELHRAGIGVILDWVPAHFPKDAHGLFEFDGEPLYEFQGKDRMEYTGWGTRKFDIARNEVECFLISNAVYWLCEFHADGIRVDAVASMLYLDYDKKPGEWNPNKFGGNESLEAIAFFKKLNSFIGYNFPDCFMIAEESTAFPNVTKNVSDDGLGFCFKWNMGWMNDILSYAQTDFDYRSVDHRKTNFSMMYAFSEKYILPISHDEVVHGKKSLLDKMPGDYWRKFAGSRVFLASMIFHPGKKLLFMGSEIGQFAEWDYHKSVEWFLLDYDMHREFQKYVSDLNFFYLKNKQLWECDSDWRGFKWLRPDDNINCVSSYMRIDKEGNELIVVLNYRPEAREDFIIDVPYHGSYREVFNSDKKIYGGSGFVNEKIIWTEKNIANPVLKIKLPPIGVTVLKNIRKTKPRK